MHRQKSAASCTAVRNKETLLILMSSSHACPSQKDIKLKSTHIVLELVIIKEFHCLFLVQALELALWCGNKNPAGGSIS